MFFFLYEAIFAIGWLPVPWLYPAELMPLRHRTYSAAIATASDWIFNYMIVQITPIMIGNISWRSYIIFFVLNVLFAVVVWLFYPETSGRSLEELDSLEWAKTIGYWLSTIGEDCCQPSRENTARTQRSWLRPLCS